MNNLKNNQKLKVNILREIWVNNDGSYIVYTAEKEDGTEMTVNCTGFELRPGKTTVVGQMREYKGQPSFKADYEEFDSNSYDSKFNLLCSIDGIKERTAAKILDALPENNIEIFYNKDVPKIKGIGPSTIEKIHKGLTFLRENKNLQNLIALVGQGVGNKNLHALNKYLLESKIEIDDFKKDPYTILIDKMGVSFKKVDYLAQNKFGCDTYLKSRCLFLTEQIIKAITGFGHTYTDSESFTNKVINLSLNPENLNNLLKDEDSRVIEDALGRIQTKAMQEAEFGIPSSLKNIEDGLSITNYEACNIDILIREYEVKNNITLHEKQKEAIIESVKSNSSLIIGGAGTGKSTIVKGIIYVLDKLNNTIICTAPTGKASRRLAEATDHKAYTCHRFYYGEEASIASGNPPDWQSSKPSTMIIDEFSMVDTILFYKVLYYMAEGKTNFTRIIMVGDPGQLPSVGAGSVMADIIKSAKIKIIELTNTFRQAEGSNILKIANMVRVNETFPRIKEKDFFVQIPPDLNGYILRCFTHQRSITSDLDTLFDEFQICTSSRKRANEINEIIQAEMGNTQFILGKKGAIGWGIGDKIMNTKNDYNNDIYNGEFGRVVSFKYRTSNMHAFEDDITIKTSEDLKKLYDSKIFIKNCTFQVYYSGLFKTVNYDLDASEVENFQLSYCTTIHKLQGSEFKICVCDVSEFNMITDSRLLYTAITRAKKQFILLSNSMETIDKIVINRLSSKRDTLLFERINKAFE